MMTDQPHPDMRKRTPLSTARERLLRTVEPVGRTAAVSLEAADGRVLAESVVAERSVPHYPRAAMDGYAVRAADIAIASEECPVTLDRRADTVDAGTAVAVGTGDRIPEGADTVVRVERIASIDEGQVIVTAAVGEGKDVAPVGEDVRAGQHLYNPGHQLRPSDLGLVKSIGRTVLKVYERPTVSVLPTGSELVHSEPAPGEIVETDGHMVATYVDRWGGIGDYADVIGDDPDAIATAITDRSSADMIVTTGGSSVGDRDFVPAIVDRLGQLVVHGVGIKPGHPFAYGVIEETPVVILPGYPVSTIVTAVQLLRPTLKRVGRMPLPDQPTTEARLATDVESDRDLRSFIRVRLEIEDGERVATPMEPAGAGVLSSVGLADGWLTVPESTTTLDAGETVSIETWEPFL